MSERVICSYCGNDELGPTDFDLLSDGKIYCWRCKWWIKDDNGDYVNILDKRAKKILEKRKKANTSLSE